MGMGGCSQQGQGAVHLPRTCLRSAVDATGGVAFCLTIYNLAMQAAWDDGTRGPETPLASPPVTQAR